MEEKKEVFTKGFKQHSRILRSKRKFKTTPFKKTSGKSLVQNLKKTLFESEVASETDSESSVVDFENFMLRLKFDLIEPEEDTESDNLEEISSDHEIFSADLEEWVLRLNSHLQEQCDKIGSFLYSDEELEWEDFVLQINKIVNGNESDAISPDIECISNEGEAAEQQNYSNGIESILPASLSEKLRDTENDASAPPELNQCVQEKMENDSAEPMKSIMIIEDDDEKISITTDPETIDNLEECSPTSSSTPIKMNDINGTPPTDNTIIDMSLANFDHTYEYRSANQIIMNTETTEKVMQILNESMQCFDEEGQLESLENIGRLQVSFVFDEEPPTVEYIETENTVTVNNVDVHSTVPIVLQNMNKHDEILNPRTNIDDLLYKPILTIRDSTTRNINLPSDFNKENIDPKNGPSQNVKIKKKVTFEPTLESTTIEIEKMNVDLDVDSPNRSENFRFKFSVDVKLIKRKLCSIQRTLKQMRINRIRRFRRFKQLNRRQSFNDRGTNTSFDILQKNSSIFLEVPRCDDKGTNTSFKNPHLDDKETNTSFDVSGKVHSVIALEVARFDVGTTFETPTDAVSEQISSMDNANVTIMEKGPPTDPDDIKTNLIEQILMDLKKNTGKSKITKKRKEKPKKSSLRSKDAPKTSESLESKKITRKSKIIAKKEVKPKKSKITAKQPVNTKKSSLKSIDTPKSQETDKVPDNESKLSPQKNVSTTSSSSSDSIAKVILVNAQIHSIPKKIISNRLSEDNNQSDDELNELSHNSILSTGFYLTQRVPGTDLIPELENHLSDELPESATRSVEKCISEEVVNLNPTPENNVSPDLPRFAVEQIVEKELIIRKQKSVSSQTDENYVSPDLPRCAVEPIIEKELIYIKQKPGSKKSNKQPKIDEIYPPQHKKIEVEARVEARVEAKKIKREDFSHQIHRTANNCFNTQTTNSSPLSDCIEASEPYKHKGVTTLPQLNDLTLNEVVHASNIDIPIFTELVIKTTKPKRSGKKRLYNKENDLNYENKISPGNRAYRPQIDYDENTVVDNNEIMHTKETLKKNTQLINKNAARRKRKELLRSKPVNEIIEKNTSFRKRTYNADDLDKNLYSTQSSEESFPCNQGYFQSDESFHSIPCNQAGYEQIVSSTQFEDNNKVNFLSSANIWSPII